MADRYRIRNQSRILQKQAEDILGKIGQDIRENKLAKASEVVRRMLQDMRSFFTDLGMPTMKKRYAPIDGPPWSDDYNKTMEEVHNDLWTIFEETRVVGDSLITNYNYDEVQRKYLQNRLSYIKDRLDDFVLFSNVRGSGVIQAKDTFKNTDKIDLGREVNPLVSINTDEGVVTLQREDSINRSLKASIRIVKSASNGFPGNTHQVKVDRHHGFDADESELTFYGEEDPHIFPEAITDGNPDSWFEYEACNIPDNEKAKYQYYGFQYQGGEWWARDPADPYTMEPPVGREAANVSTPLRLVLELRLPEPTVINWININPYIPPFDGALPPKVVDIQVSDGEEYKRSITSETDRNLVLSEELNEAPATYRDDEVPGISDFTGQGVYTFAPTLAKTITIELEQEAPYICDIGHIAWHRIDTVKETKTGLLGIRKKVSREVTKTLVEGPKTPVSALYIDRDDNLGIGGFLDGFGPIGGAFGDFLSGISGIIFGTKTVELENSEIISERLKIDGWRWAIGLRDVDIYSYSYAPLSEFVSKEHMAGAPIKRVSLTVNEEIPKVFLEQGWAKRNDWIKYFISVDGNHWHRISPQGHSETIDEYTGEVVPEVYTINSDLDSGNRNPRVGYIDIDSDPTSIRLRAVLTRPQNIRDAKAFTPILRGYSLKMQAGGDSDEY